MTILKIPWFAVALFVFLSPLHAQPPTPEKQLIAAIEKIGGKVTLDKKVPGRIVAVNY